jgi:hypothetical protein
MRNHLFTRKARWACGWSLLLIVWLSTTPWLGRQGMRSGAVVAQATNAPGTPPEILGFNVSRTVLSHGRVENARQATPINPNGLRDVQGFGDPTTGRPGLLTAIATPSPAWQPDSLHITMGWDPNFSKEPLGIGASATNPITLAAAGIPSCFTLIVADGIGPAFTGGPGSIPGAVRWQSTGPLIGQGNLYASVSLPAAGIIAGMELRTEEQLAAYTANSIVWEAPPFGQVVQDTTLMQFGTKNITAQALDLSDPANPVMGPAQSAQVEVTRTLHVEIEVLGITQNQDGTFRLCAIANLFGNSLEPVTSFWFRWGFDGQTTDLVGDIRGTNRVTIPRIPAAEKDQLAELYVVASCNGSLLTGNPFTAEPLGVPPDVFVRKSIGLLTFVSGGCTLEDDQSVKITPFGECLAAEMRIEQLESIGSAATGGENVWVRTTPAQGEVVYGTIPANATLTENSSTFREVNPSGEQVSNTLTWTTPPERIIDDGKPVPEITYGIQQHATDGLTPDERVARAVEKCRYRGEMRVTGTPFAAIDGGQFIQTAAAGGRREMSGSAGSAGRKSVPIGFDLDPSYPQARVETFVVLPISYHSWKGESVSISIRWRYVYSKSERLATVTRDGQELEAQKGMKVFEGDLVRTQANCRMALNVTNGKGLTLAALAVSPSTDFDIRQLTLGIPNRFDFALHSGEIRSEVIPERGPTQFRVITPTAAAAVAGTIFTTGYEAREQASSVAVEQGAVLVTPTNTELQPVTVNAGQQVKVTQNRVGPVAAYSINYFGGVTGKLLYVGIGAAMLVFIAISALIVWRAKRRSANGGKARRGRQSGPPATLSAEPLLPPGPPVEQTFCGRCGAPLKPDKPFCTACGEPQRPAGVSGSGTAIGAGLEGRLPDRTTPIPRLCSNPQCRKPLVPGKRFCTKCGTSVM